MRKNRVGMSSAPQSGMEDVNEQELAKDTDGRQLFDSTDADKDSSEEQSLSASFSDDAKNGRESEPVERAEQDGEGASEISLPLLVPEKTEIVEIPPAEEQSEIGDEPEEQPRREEPQKPPQKRQNESHRSGGGWLYIAVIALCLITAIALLAMSMMKKAPEQETESEDTVFTYEQSPDSDTAETVEKLSAEQIYGACRSSSVTVTAVTPEGEKHISGTAVFGDGYVATVYSGVAQAITIEITDQDGKRYPAQMVGGNQTVNLALLKTYSETLGYVEKLSTADFQTGNKLYAIGTASEAQYGGSLCEGVVAFGERALEIIQGDTVRRATAVQLSGFNDSSLCGSPVFNEKGQAVALVWSSRTGEAVSLALPMERVLNVLEYIKNGEEPAAEALKSIAYMAPSLGIIGENYSEGDIYGVRVTDFSTPSCDAAIQLRRNDIIIKVNDTLTPDTSSIKEAIYALAPEDKVEIFFIRDGQQLSYIVELY